MQPDGARGSNASVVITVLGVGFTTGLIPAGLLPASVLNIERTYGLTHSDVGRVVGLCMALGGASGGLAGGLICGHQGALRTVLAGLALAGSALACIGLVPTLAATAGGLAAFFFASGFLGSANALATHLFPDRQRGITLMHGTNAIGKLTGPALASLFVYGVWRQSFLVAAILPFALVVPALLAHLGDKTAVGRKAPGAIRAGAGLWIAMAGFALIAGGEMGVVLWLPALGQQSRGFAPAQANMLLSAFLLGLAAGRLTASAYSHRIAPRTTIGACSLLLVAVGGVAGFTGYTLVLLSSLILGLGISAVWPAYFAHLSRVYPEHLGLMGGASVFCTQVGFAACAYISGRLADVHLSYPVLFGAGVVALFSIVFFLSPISRRA